MDKQPPPHRNGERRAISRRRTPWLITGAVTAVAALTAGGVVTLQPRDQQPGALPQAAASAIAVSAAAASSAGARPVPATAADLQRVADRLVAAPYEARKGRFEYTDIRIWEIFTDEAVTPPTGSQPPVVSTRRIRYWTNAGDRGRSHAVDEARGCPAEDETWINQEASPWGGPLSSDPDAVRRQLLGPSPNQGIDLFGQIGELYGNRIVPLATRRGLLTMLARRRHIMVQRNVTDAAGRVGIAVTDTAEPAVPPPGPPFRKTLIFDPVTGDLLAGVTTPGTTTNIRDYATPPGQQSDTLGYTLHLTRHYTPNVRTPQPDCGDEPQARHRTRP